MSGRSMVALVGQQPIPNLLGIRYEGPDSVLLLETDRTRSVSERLGRLIAGEVARVERLKVAAYDIAAIRAALRTAVDQLGGQEGVTYNLTGGTKPMMIAAYELARQHQRPFAYVQSEGGSNLIYRYGFVGGEAAISESKELPTLLDIDDYVLAHVPSYTLRETDQWFEKLVYRELSSSQRFDELVQCVKVGNALEIDLVLRLGNYVGFAELKSGADETHKSGVDQLGTAADREAFGTYTRRLLINDRQLDHNVIGLAAARGVRVISLKSARPDRSSLSSEDRTTLIDTTLRHLGRFGDRA